ncbi:MAG: cobalamin B12-binding domain-containing protein [Georgfuchsia sp.]
MIEKSEQRIKVLITKPGLDGHDLGAKYISRSLRDNGFEVIYMGLQQTPENIVSAALQEDVDVVGCSLLSGAHVGWMRKIMHGLEQAGRSDLCVIVGGAIPKNDVPILKGFGVAEVFSTGSHVEDIAAFIRQAVRQPV